MNVWHCFTCERTQADLYPKMGIDENVAALRAVGWQNIHDGRKDERNAANTAVRCPLCVKEATPVGDTVGGDMPGWLKDVFDKGFAGLPPFLLKTLVSSLVSTAIDRLSTQDRIEVLMFIAEKLWPGATSRACAECGMNLNCKPTCKRQTYPFT
jgi:hypothetical protein